MKASEQKLQIINCIEIDISTLEHMTGVFKEKDEDDSDWNSLFISIFTFLAEKLLKLILLEKSALLLNTKIEPSDYIDELKTPGSGYKFKPGNWVGLDESFERVTKFFPMQKHKELLQRMATVRNGHVHCFHIKDRSKISRYLFNEKVLKFINELSELAAKTCDEYGKLDIQDRISSIEVYTDYSWDIHKINTRMDKAKKQIDGGRLIGAVLNEVYEFKDLGDYTYEAGGCPNCNEPATVIFSADFEENEDDWEESIWSCQITAIFCKSCGFAADSSEVCEQLNPDFDQKDYQEECFKEETERNAHGEVISVNLTPVSSYQVARMKISGIYASWEWDF